MLPLGFIPDGYSSTLSIQVLAINLALLIFTSRIRIIHLRLLIFCKHISNGKSVITELLMKRDPRLATRSPRHSFSGFLVSYPCHLGSFLDCYMLRSIF